VVAYLVRAWPIGAGAQYCLIALASLAATLLLYDLGIRRSPVTRFLFGLKPRRGPSPRTDAHSARQGRQPREPSRSSPSRQAS
jgi:hypothetical protein